MRTRDQNSPLELHQLIVPAIKGRAIGDIGCGNGLHAYIVRTALADSSKGPLKIYGVDFSSKAVAKIRRHRLYERALLASSERLPLPARSVDTAMCIENLEHLYADQVVPAIAELKRIARRRVLITTPWPGHVANRAWLRQEIAEAEADPHPIPGPEFSDLAGYVHKSTVVPSSMVAAGFENPVRANSLAPLSALYIGDPSRLDLSKIQVVGLPFRRYRPSRDHRQDYLGLLRGSQALSKKAPWQWRMAAVHAWAALRRLRSGMRAVADGILQR
jgi:SAM-dependent methyltransferase